jgi:hypothetical protein
MERHADAVLLECGHSGLCVECATVLWNQARRCPLCRRGFAAIMRIVACSADTVIEALFQSSRPVFCAPSTYKRSQQVSSRAA